MAERPDWAKTDATAAPAWAGGGVPRGTAPPDVPQLDASGKLIRPAPTTQANPSVLDKVKGVGEAGLAVATGIPASLAGQFGGLLKIVAEGKAGTPEGAREGAEYAAGITGYRPRTETGQDYLSGFGKFLDSTKLAGLNPAVGMEAAALSSPAVSVGRRAVTQSPEAFAVRQAAAKAKGAVTPTVDAQTLGLVKKAEEMGISVPPDKLSDNRFMRIIGQAARDVPLSGSGVAENRAAFNKAIIRTFGGDERGGKITPQVFGAAMKEHGGAIGDISAKNPIPYTPQLRGAFGELAENARNFGADGVERIIPNYVKKIEELGQAKGQIDGVAFKNLRSEITKKMRASEGQVRLALSELDDAMLDAVQGTLSPTELTDFNRARQFYANGKTIEPLVAKAAAKGGGDMSPAALSSQVVSNAGRKTAVAQGRGGPLADISAVGSRFLTEPGSSNTAERGLVYGSALGGGAYLEPTLAASLYGAANLYNRFGPDFTRLLLSAKP